MSHGNWKDLVAASKVGDVDKMRYYLQHESIDPTFQHPEYMTAPIFEAIRHSQGVAVRLLIDHDKENLSIVEAYSGMTPLESAMDEKKHDMVDILLSYSKFLPKQQLQLVQTIFCLCQLERSIEIDIVCKLLEKGHRVVVAVPLPSSNDSEKQIVEQLVGKTGNKKFHICPLSLTSEAKSYSLSAVIDLRRRVQAESLNFLDQMRSDAKCVVLLDSGDDVESARRVAKEWGNWKKQHHTSSSTHPLMFVLPPSSLGMSLDRIRDFIGMSTAKNMAAETISNLVTEPEDSGLPLQDDADFITLNYDGTLVQN
mmetsp:Transcript_15633/g.43117  ORF Transcript_15633/g.43117 Transcript_15633/m.43117 type:complete len:311 (+) Transcript_15633:79-1011(+)